MGHFSIDDVRESFRADITAFLNQMTAVSALMATAMPALTESMTKAEDTKAFDFFRDGGHSIHGTASLVEAEALATSASRMEELAKRGEEALRAARMNIERAQAIMSVCADGANEMRAMLVLELEKEAANAKWLAASWAERVDRVRSEDETRRLAVVQALSRQVPSRLPPAKPSVVPDAAHAQEGGEGYAFASEPPPALTKSKALPADFDDQLRKVFREESNAALTQLRGYMEQFAWDPSDTELLGNLERVYTSIEGSASSIGLEAAREVASRLNGLVTSLQKKIAIPNAAFIESVVSGTNELLRACGVSDITPGQGGSIVASAPVFEKLPSTAPESPVLEGMDADLARELLPVFQEETRELVGNLLEALGIFVVMPNDPTNAKTLYRAYHTLKGAAATVGLSALSQIAAQLQNLFEAVTNGERTLTSASVPDVIEQTARLFKMADLADLVQRLPTPPKPSSPPIRVEEESVFRFDDDRSLGTHLTGGSAPEPFDRELLAIFQGEASEFFVALQGHLTILAKDPSNTSSVQHVERIFHTLHGAAATVGLDPVSALAGKLQQRFEALVEGKSKLSREALEEVLSDVRELLRLTGMPQGILSMGDAPLPHKDPSIDGRISHGGDSALSARSHRSVSNVVRENVTIPAERELWDAFMQETTEILESLDRTVFGLEESETPKQSLELCFQYIHTLKGAVNTVGISPTGRELHRVEDFLEGLLAARMLPAMRSVTTLLLQVVQNVRRQLREAAKGYVETDMPRLEAAIANVFSARRVGDGPPSMSDARSHRSQNSADLVSQRSANASANAEDAAQRTFIRVPTERLDSLMALAGELVVSRSRLLTHVTTMRTLQGELGRTRSRLLDVVDTFRHENEFANLDGRSRSLALRPVPTQPQALMLGAGGDTMVDPAPQAMTPHVGGFSEIELDKYGAVHILSRSLGEVGDDFDEVYRDLSSQLVGFTDASETFSTIISGIQSEVTRARMVQLESLFARLQMSIRDAAVRDDKEVRVKTIGADVSVDKTIADALFAPLLHLVRNAVVHGLEASGDRVGRRKDAVGTILLRARQESGQIVVEVIDDGAGLDLAALHARGIAMGLLPPDIAVDNPHVKDMVFASGLSTKGEAGDVAGRGMGGDIVRRTIERLNGDVRVDTKAGQGTTFSITLPMSLAITRALLVKQGASTYAIPLYFAERIVDAEEHMAYAGDTPHLRIDNTLFRVRSGAEVFGAGRNSTKGPVLLLRVGEQRTAVQVDAVVGQEEIVVKSLGDLLAGHPVFAGVTVRGNGELVLIVDVPSVMDATGGMDGTSAPSQKPPAMPMEAKALPAVAPAVAKKVKPTDDVVAEAGEPMRVLLVDDSLSVRKFGETILKGLGLDVTVAVDGVEGLERIRTGKFDLVFTDLEMPRMHGYDLLREVRMIPRFKKLPIIVITSRSGKRHEEQARSLGATDYLTKPFNSQTLDQAIKTWGRKR